jgi:translation elongation factor EF-Tu-like GTPase
MGSDYKKVRAKAYFLSPEEGGRSQNVDLRDPQGPVYRLLADFGFGHTKEGYKMHCAAQVMLDKPGFIELGLEQAVLIAFQCPERAVKPGARFDLSEGSKIVASGIVLSVLETTVPQ